MLTSSKNIRMFGSDYMAFRLANKDLSFIINHFFDLNEKRNSGKPNKNSYNTVR